MLYALRPILVTDLSRRRLEVILEVAGRGFVESIVKNHMVRYRYDSCLRTRISWPMAISRYLAPIEARLVRAFLFPLSRSQTARSCLVLNPRCS